MISTESTVVASKTQVSSSLAGEAVILDVEGGTYYGLDAVGFRIWDLVQEPRTVRTIVNALLAEYDVDREQCERDVLALLDRLARTGLIEVGGADAP